MKLAQTGDIVRPKVAAMFTFVRVVVEPGVRTAAVEWEAPTKRSLAMYFLLSDDRSIAGVAASSIAAQPLLLLLRVPQQQNEVVIHRPGRKSLDRAVDGA